MSVEVDFKALWNKEEAKDMPDIKELLKRAERLRRITRFKLIFQCVSLLATIGVMLYAGFRIAHQQLTTAIGLVLMIGAIASYLVAAMPLLPMLFKSDLEGSSQEYLNQLLRIKRKNEFLDRVMLNVYFGFLSLGLLLYSLQTLKKLSTGWGVFYVVLTFGLMGLAWFCAKPRRMRKQKTWNDITEKLERVIAQLDSLQ